MPIDFNKSVVACVRPSDCPKGSFIPYFLKRLPCNGCGTEILLSPCSLEILKESKHQPLCFDCATIWKAFKLVIQNREVIEIVPPGAEEDIKRMEREDAERN